MHSIPRPLPTMTGTHAHLPSAPPACHRHRSLPPIDNLGHITQSESLNPKRTCVAPAQEYVKASAPVLEERVRKHAIHEIVPMVMREREVAEVRHTVLPIHQHIRPGRTYSERRLPEINEPEYRVGTSKTELGKNRALAERLSKGYMEELPTEHEYVYRKPRVEEVVRLLQRHVNRIHHERTYASIHEGVLESPRVIEQVDVQTGMSEDEWMALRQHAVWVAKPIGMPDELNPTSSPIPTAFDADRQYQRYLEQRRRLPSPTVTLDSRPARMALPAPWDR
ncbi:hypothetical protein BCR44DRAFT_1424709, partial [Catenaria anguillulae PL171]